MAVKPPRSPLPRAFARIRFRSKRAAGCMATVDILFPFAFASRKRNSRLFMNRIERLPDQVAVSRCCEHPFVSRKWDIDVDDELGPAWPRRHHDDTMTEEHGLFDIVGNE